MTMTIREAQKWAFSILTESGLDRTGALFSAERLIRHVLDWDRARFFACLEEVFPSEQLDRFKYLVQQRANRVPLQQLIGSQEFYGRSFRITRDVLIPRPETEGLVEAVLREGERMWEDGPCHAVDVGTGSGVIAVTLALERPHWHVTATDVSSAALYVAKKNAEAHGVTQRITFRQGDLLTPVTDVAPGQVDIVVSNPPYIPTGDIAQLAPEVKQYEPFIALDGGDDGLSVYRRLISSLPAVVKRDKGLVALEVGFGQSDDVVALCKQALPWADIFVETDLAGIERVVLVRWEK